MIKNNIIIYRSPSEREQKWIIDNCRTTPDIPLGPRKDLYEEWIGPLEVLPVPGEESFKEQN